VALLIGGAVLLSGTDSGRFRGREAIADGSAEQAYASQIHFPRTQKSRAANFLNQEVTYCFLHG